MRPHLINFKTACPNNCRSPQTPTYGSRDFVFCFVALTGFSSILKNTRTLDNLTATGLVRGRVVDENGQPFQGKVFILGTKLITETDANGNFELSRVPAGNRTLVVADELSGRAFEIQVATASEFQMGQIRFQPTATP